MDEFNEEITGTSTHTIEEFISQINNVAEAVSTVENTTTSTTILSNEEEELLQRTIEETHQEIPTNSPTILIEEETSRFSSAVWFDKIREKTITLAGLGGIGSYVGFLLSRVRPEQMYIYDNDKVDASNLSGQLYSRTDIGNYKTNSLFNMMVRYSNYYALQATRLFTANSTPTNIMICGFDNMEARDVFYHSWKAHVNKKSEEERSKCLFIDGRLAAEEFQIFCITGDNKYAMDKYEKEFLFSDTQAEATICSYKQTSYCANMIATYMINIFVNFVANECNPVMPRIIPFYTYYNAELMYLKIEE